MSFALTLLACLTVDESNKDPLGGGPDPWRDETNGNPITIDTADTGAGETEELPDVPGGGGGDTDTDEPGGGDTDTDEPGGGDTDTGDTGGTGSTDADGDGYPATTDCDDTDDTVHPGASDAYCDLVDNDCDGVADDEFSDDTWEPNDSEAVYLGDWTDIENAYLTANFFPDGDVDFFMFYADDGWFSSFEFDIEMTDVGETDGALVLYKFDEDSKDWVEVAYEDSAGTGGDELMYYEGTWGLDDTGYYLLAAFAADGSMDCTGQYMVTFY